VTKNEDYRTRKLSIIKKAKSLQRARYLMSRLQLYPVEVMALLNLEVG